MNNYVVRVSGEIAGTWRNAGDVISLTARQALYLAPPLASVVQPVGDNANGGLNRRKRRNRKAAE